MVIGGRRQHHGRLWSGQESRWHRSIPSICFLRRAWLHLLHQLNWLHVEYHCTLPGVWAGVTDSMSRLLRREFIRNSLTEHEEPEIGYTLK